jgi:DNA-binding transcriptional ArsR family regulator
MTVADSGELVLDALADPTRRRLVTLLGARDSATATELAAELPITRQAVSKHLSVLGEVGLVDSQPEGRAVRYRLTPAPLSGAMAWMAGVGAQWDARLAELKRRLEDQG